MNKNEGENKETMTTANDKQLHAVLARKWLTSSVRIGKVSWDGKSQGIYRDLSEERKKGGGFPKGWNYMSKGLQVEKY